MWRVNRNQAGSVAFGLTVVALTGLGGGAWYASRPGDATEVRIVTCGIAAVPPILRVPSDILAEVADYVPVNIGPMTVPGIDHPVRIRFFSVADQDGKQATKKGDEISLPILVGDQPRIPDSVTLKCRYGQLATAAYDYSGESVQLAIAHLSGGTERR